MTVFDIEVGQERYPENLRDGWVSIDRSGDGVDQFDDQLGDPISGSGLAAEDDRTGCPAGTGARLIRLKRVTT